VIDSEMPPRGELLLYQTEDGRTRVECRFEDDTLWLSQALIAELFGKDVSTINEHLQNIYQENELRVDRTIRKFRIVRLEGRREVARMIDHYNLDAILAVGYRVRSSRGTQFRQWATERLREYLMKGFTMDDERLRNPPVAGSGVPDYFDELLERIRDIRASERRMYLRVKEIFAMAADYVPSAPETGTFFAIMQNKLHYAATGYTAAELIARRADHSLPNMGLNTWKGDAVTRSDVTVAKNYLREDERTESHRGDVAGFCRGPGAASQAGFPARLGNQAGRLSAVQRARGTGERRLGRQAEADEQARAEYEQFAARRRALMEAEGERAAIAALENTARRLKPGPRAD
jgi:hypothetical protein